MGDHVNECMTYRNRLKALGAEIPREFFVQELLDVDKEYMFMRASLRTQSPEQIVAALMEQYQLFQTTLTFTQPEASSFCVSVDSDASNLLAHVPATGSQSCPSLFSSNDIRM